MSGSSEEHFPSWSKMERQNGGLQEGEKENEKKEKEKERKEKMHTYKLERERGH